MSIRNRDPLPALGGLTVMSAVSGRDDDGYGFVELRFVGGTILKIEEVGQAGEIKWSLPTRPSNPRTTNPWDE